MITELRLENWKSFGEATLYIDPLTILIGTNASGKSNVLDALQFLQNIAQGMRVCVALDKIRGGKDWSIKKTYNKFSLCFIVDTDKGLQYEYCIVCEVTGEQCVILSEEVQVKNISINNELIGKMLFSVKQPNEFGSDYSILNLSTLAIGTYFTVEGDDSFADADRRTGLGVIFNSLNNILILAPNPPEMISYASLSEKLLPNASNIAGVLAALPIDKQKKIETVLTEYSSRLPERDIHRVYAEKVGKLGKDAMLYCDEKWTDSGETFTVDARAMSDGTLRFLAILTALLTLPEGSLLAIDEVDNGLHPSRANLLLKALYEIGKQRKIDVLITTHNSALLDALGTTFIPFITVAHRDVHTGESKLTLLEDIDQLPKLLAQGTVGKLAARGLLEKSLESQHE